MDDNLRSRIVEALYQDVDNAFPRMEFVNRNGRYQSKIHLNGERDGHGEFTTSIDPRTKRVKDWSQSGTMSLIDLYADLHGLRFPEAVNELCQRYAIPQPEYNGKEWNDWITLQQSRRRTQGLFRRALMEQQEGDETLVKGVWNYLHERGFEGEGAEGSMGVATPSVMEQIRRDEPLVYTEISHIKETHPLVLSWESGDTLMGFIFRALDPDATPKYIYSKGLQKSRLFGLGIGVEDATLVEGPIDVLHARTKGVETLVATGGAPSENQLQNAINAGVKRFTLIFDKDEAGNSFTDQAIRIIERIALKEGRELSVFVATLPEGYKDPSEYLRTHKGEELQSIINKSAQPFAIYGADKVCAKYAGIGPLTEKQRADFINEQYRILTSPLVLPYDRIRVANAIEKSVGISSSEILNAAANERMIQLANVRKAEVEQATRVAADMATRGEIDAAVNVMRDAAAKADVSAKASQYAEEFRCHTPEEVSNDLSKLPEGTPTGFVFVGDDGGEPYSQFEESVRTYTDYDLRRYTNVTELTLFPGLSFICGSTGHGKTTFLNNIAINEATRLLQRGSKASVLYFSYEVDRRRLMKSLINTYVNDPEMNARGSRDAIESYFKGDGDRYFNKGTTPRALSHFTNFEVKKDVFLRDYIATGRLKVIDITHKVGDLLNAIKYHVSKVGEVSIVCIDYAQLIYSETYSRQRTEEIKQVVNDIKDYANAAGIPFVLAAQFNRQVDSPAGVLTNNIGEGGDFERIADSCIGIYNLSKLHVLRDATETENAIDTLRRVGLSMDEGLEKRDGMLFVRLMKSRIGAFPIDTLLKWEPRTGYITPNKESASTPRQQVISEDVDRPF